MRFALLLLALAATVAASPRNQADEAKRIAAELIAPCCWSQQVSEHQSAIAVEMRQEIADDLAAGRTHDQIIQMYVARYGTRILAEPPARGFSLTLHAWPWISLAASLLLIALVVRRLTRAAPAAAPAEPIPSDAAYAERVSDELRDLD